MDLYLSGDSTTRATSESLARFLQRGGTAIKKLVCSYNVDAESVQMILRSIPKNSTLRELSITEFALERRQATSWLVDGSPAPPVTDEDPEKTMEHLLCNRRDFSSICESNHILSDVRYSYGPLAHEQKTHEFIKQMLGIKNGRSSCSVNQRLRAKLRAVYFKGDFCI